MAVLRCLFFSAIIAIFMRVIVKGQTEDGIWWVEFIVDMFFIAFMSCVLLFVL